MHLSELPKPAIIAHRGASAYAPENTLAAFKLALHQGADALELDAKLTKDSHVVIIHDQTVDRTTSSVGRVKDLTLEEIQKLDAGSHFDISCCGETIPTLDDVLEAVGQLTYINIELTNYASPFDELPEKVAYIVNNHKLNQRIFFSSFNPIVLSSIQRLMPEAPCGLLALPGWKGAIARSFLGHLPCYQSLNPEVRDISEKLIRSAHHRNQKVYTYTVNQKDIIEKMFNIDIDGIFTDDPVTAKQVLTKKNIAPST